MISSARARPAAVSVSRCSRIGTRSGRPISARIASKSSTGSVSVPSRSKITARGTMAFTRSRASGAPPVRATSSFLILPTSMPLTRLVIDGSSSSIGGGSPLMKRSGLVRETTKLRRYGLLKPRAFSFAIASVTASS